jgi:hypothetical protein
MIRLRDITWAAGMYESEGSFSGTQAVVVQKDPWVLHRLVRIFKFGSIRPHGDNCYQWGISGENARGFLLTIFTELSPRRRAQILEHKKFFIDDMFKRQSVCRNGHPKTEENTRRVWNNRRQDFDYVCIICDKAGNKKDNAPMNIAARNLAKIRGISKEEALEFLLKSSNPEEDSTDEGETIQ